MSHKSGTNLNSSNSHSLYKYVDDGRFAKTAWTIGGGRVAFVGVFNPAESDSNELESDTSFMTGEQHQK